MSGVSISDAGITVDAALVAEGYNLREAQVRELMRAGAITSRCEVGKGADSGRVRLNFFYGNRVLRLTTDETGNLIEPARIEIARSTSSRPRQRGIGGTDKSG